MTTEMLTWWWDRTDIEQEVNGLYSIDREEKVPAGDVKEFIDAAKKLYYGNLRKCVSSKTL